MARACLSEPQNKIEICVLIIVSGSSLLSRGERLTPNIDKVMPDFEKKGLNIQK